MKRKIFLALTMVAAMTFLASCSACDSCAGNTKVSFKDYYLNDVDYPITEVHETLSYKVSHSGNTSYNGYTVEYSNGTNEWTLTKNKGEDFYTLTRNFSIDVLFTYGGVSTEKFTDTITSSVAFYSAKNMLQPISSEKTIVCHSPSQSTVDSLDDCYTLYNQTVKTVYNEDATGGEATITNNENGAVSTDEFEIEDTDKYTYVDNELLLFALRCMNPSSTAKVQVYAPFNQATQVISTAFGSSAAADFEGLTVNGETKTAEISYVPVTLEIEAKNSGSAQTAWIAETKDAKNNTYRNVMLKYTVPLPFALGELNYELVSATFA
ncbi:MAG: hypothetical protein IJ329_03755 [Clostridia bacterium]|nr:hypothetical protein [Clostridia bacterium]